MNKRDRETSHGSKALSLGDSKEVPVAGLFHKTSTEGPALQATLFLSFSDRNLLVFQTGLELVILQL